MTPLDLIFTVAAMRTIGATARVVPPRMSATPSFLIACNEYAMIGMLSILTRRRYPIPHG